MSFAQRAGPALLSRQFAPEVQNRRCATRVKVTSSLAAMAAVVAAVAGPSTPVGSATPVPTRHLETSSGGGKVTTSISPGSASISALVRQPDAKLVAAGSGVIEAGLNTKSAYFALARYNPDGSLDTSFGRGGKVTTSIGRLSFASALIRQPDGKLVVAGLSGSSDSNGKVTLVRYNSDGSRDTSFGRGGTATTAIGRGVTLNNVSSLVREPDGKLVAAGDGSKGSFEYFVLVRYMSDGRLDTSFGRGGKVTTPINTSYGDYSASALLLEPDGKLVAAAGSASATGPPSGFVLVRYNPDGSLDRAFGRGGKVNAPGTSASDIKEGLVRLPDGKLVAAGAGSLSALTLARYKNNGKLDTSFGRNGKVTTVVGTTIDFESALILAPDGKLLAAGGAGLPYGPGAGFNDFFVLRYDRGGSLDKSFGRRGKVTTVFRTGGNDIAQALLRQPDGKLVAAGSSAGGSGFEFALARYNANGSLDTSFGR